MQWAQKLLSTRGGTIALSVMAAVLAGVILLAYLHRYRESVNEASTEVTVLTANGLIKKGTSGDVIASENLYGVSEQAKGDVADGAITDPAALKGRVATDIGIHQGRGDDQSPGSCCRLRVRLAAGHQGHR